jgi:YVTN family beta-propeller protein
VEALSQIEKKCHIFLIIIIAVVICTSIIVLPYNAVGKTSHILEIERNSIVQNVPSFNVGVSPRDIDVDQLDDIVYVANYHSNTVSVINGDTLKVSKVTVGKNPESIAVDHNNIAYVANYGSNTVSVIKETDGIYSNIANIPVGLRPESIAVDQANNIAYVANSGSNTVSVINTTDGDYSNIANVTVGEFPESIAVDLYQTRNIAYVANYGSNTVSVIKETDGIYSNIANVTVGDGPESIAVDQITDDIAYVANSDSNTVSVIKISEGGYSNIANIPVGDGPESIAVDQANNIAYVGNYYSNTVSVIKETDGIYSNIANVTVGDGPESIAVDLNDIAYVANSDSNTVSVIKETDGIYSNIANVTVGDGPEGISLDYKDNIAYVANSDSNTVSVIYGPSQRVQAGVSFDVNPFYAGHIVCNNITVPTNQYFYVDFHTQCLAQPHKGFQFGSWIENLGSNSSRTLNASTPDSSIDWVKSALHFGSKQTSSILTVTKFGNFIAKFENLPPAIPTEYLISLYGIILSSIVGWSIPSIVGWLKTKKMIRTSNSYHKIISSLYEDNKLDHNNMTSLDKIKIDMSEAYAKGRISDQHYQNLKDDISVLYEKIFKQKIDVLNIIPNEGNHKKLIEKIRDEMTDAYSKGKLNELHYNLLKEKLSENIEKNNNIK